MALRARVAVLTRRAQWPNHARVSTTPSKSSGLRGFTAGLWTVRAFGVTMALMSWFDLRILYTQIIALTITGYAAWTVVRPVLPSVGQNAVWLVRAAWKTCTTRRVNLRNVLHYVKYRSCFHMLVAGTTLGQLISMLLAGTVEGHYSIPILGPYAVDSLLAAQVAALFMVIQCVAKRTDSRASTSSTLPKWVTLNFRRRTRTRWLIALAWYLANQCLALADTIYQHSCSAHRIADARFVIWISLNVMSLLVFFALPFLLLLLRQYSVLRGSRMSAIGIFGLSILFGLFVLEWLPIDK